MSDHSIPDALAADLRELFLEDQPVSPDLPEDSLRHKFETEQVITPRLVFLCGDPKRIEGQDATARVPFTIELVNSLDRADPETHRTDAGKIDAWLRAIRISHRRAVLGSRSYLHDLYCMHPVFSFREEREQVATIRGEAVVTLAVTTPAI